MKHKKSYNRRWMKWLLLYPSGPELKKLVEKQRRRNLRALVRWNGGVSHKWHPESTEMLLCKHNVLRKRRRKRYR